MVVVVVVVHIYFGKTFTVCLRILVNIQVPTKTSKEVDLTNDKILHINNQQ